MTTRLVMFDMLLQGRVVPFVYEVTRTSGADSGLPPEYTCSLVSGDCTADDIDDCEDAAIRVFEEELAEFPACPHCGEHNGPLRAVEYDAMVDGPGCVVTEELCTQCMRGAA